MTQPITVSTTLTLTQIYALVDEGTELRRDVEAKNARLEEIKANLREAAKSGLFEATETGTVEIRSPESENCAQIIPCKDTPVLIEGKDPKNLKASLTASEFGLMFREVVVLQPAKDFETAFKVASKKVQGAVKKFVSWRPNASAVKFSK